MSVLFNQKRNSNDVLAGFRMPEEMASRIERLCQQLDLSRSQIVRRCIENYGPYKQCNPIQPRPSQEHREVVSR
jgi:hypothetical protein